MSFRLIVYTIMYHVYNTCILKTNITDYGIFTQYNVIRYDLAIKYTNTTIVKYPQFRSRHLLRKNIIIYTNYNIICKIQLYIHISQISFFYRRFTMCIFDPRFSL